MRILIVNTSDLNGGAARAAYRLHKALLSKNIDSQMIVQVKSSDDYTVKYNFSKVQNVFNKFRPILDSVPVRCYDNKALFSPSWIPSREIVDRINELAPDIVHLHWITSGMIRIEDLVRIQAPIVWSLHDMWAFTGGCHYDEYCGRYKNVCGECVVLSSNNKNDISRKNFYRKQKTYSKIPNMTVIGLSKWMKISAQESALFRDKKIVNLPNPIDTKVFKPFDKISSRELWDLPVEKKLVLFGAMGATTDVRKGFNELSVSLKMLNREDLEFVVFGATLPSDPPNLGCKVHYMGSLSDDVSLITLYSAVDLMVVPSLQENLSNAIVESLACGTPVVGFDIGGNSDLINHKFNGYLAQPFDSADLAKGIEWGIDNNNCNQLGENSRDKMVRELDSSIVVEKYIDLYKEILSD